MGQYPTMTLSFIILNWQQDQLDDTTLSDSEEEEEEEEEDYDDNEVTEQGSEGVGPQAKCPTIKQYQKYIPPSAALLPCCQ